MVLILGLLPCLPLAMIRLHLHALDQGQHLLLDGLQSGSAMHSCSCIHILCDADSQSHTCSELSILIQASFETHWTINALFSSRLMAWYATSYRWPSSSPPCGPSCGRLPPYRYIYTSECYTKHLYTYTHNLYMHMCSYLHMYQFTQHQIYINQYTYTHICIYIIYSSIGMHITRLQYA